MACWLQKHAQMLSSVSFYPFKYFAAPPLDHSYSSPFHTSIVLSCSLSLHQSFWPQARFHIVLLFHLHWPRSLSLSSFLHTQRVFLLAFLHYSEILTIPPIDNEQNLPDRKYHCVCKALRSVNSVNVQVCLRAYLWYTCRMVGVGGWAGAWRRGPVGACLVLSWFP